LWTGEAVFACEGVFNSHSSHWWAQDSSHVTHERSRQVCWGINVWAIIIDTIVAGTIPTPHWLIGPMYCVSARSCTSGA
jgi:hypothetical protein